MSSSYFVLMKLKLAIQNQDLAYRFGIHVTKVSKVFHLWIDVMFREMKQLISWPDRELIIFQKAQSHISIVYGPVF